jgi:predicted GIY-YIG superfamily endonuclease
MTIEAEAQVYRMFDHSAQLLYVGVTCDIDKRFMAHARQKPWYDEVATVDITERMPRSEALQMEADAIRSEAPRYNVRGTGVVPAPREIPTGDVCVRMDVDLHAQVKAYAHANDLTMAQVIRAAVRDKLHGSTSIISVDLTGDTDPAKVGRQVKAAVCDHPRSKREVRNGGIVFCRACDSVVR